MSAVLLEIGTVIVFIKTFPVSGLVAANPRASRPVAPRSPQFRIRGLGHDGHVFVLVRAPFFDNRPGHLTRVDLFQRANFFGNVDALVDQLQARESFCLVGAEPLRPQFASFLRH